MRKLLPTPRGWLNWALRWAARERGVRFSNVSISRCKPSCIESPRLWDQPRFNREAGAVGQFGSGAAVEACPGRDRRTALMERRATAKLTLYAWPNSLASDAPSLL